VVGLLAPAPALAQDDYALASEAWNGLGEVGMLARALGIEVVEVRSLDLSTIGPATPLLILYPRGELPADDLLRFLRTGGRLAIADDFGASSSLLERLGVRRQNGPFADPPGAVNDNANLPLAVTRQPHPLNAGVDQRSQGHVAADAAGTVEVGDFHRRLLSRWRPLVAAQSVEEIPGTF